MLLGVRLNGTENNIVLFSLRCRNRDEDVGGAGKVGLTDSVAPLVCLWLLLFMIPE